jgi:hypothetical protein
MPRQRRGAIFVQKGKIIARVRWKNAEGKTKELERVAQNQAEAETLLKEILALSEKDTPSKSTKPLPSPPPIASSGSEENGYHRSFNELAAAYEAENLQPALIVDGHKVDGLKSLNNAKRNLRRMREAYGGMLLKNITYGHIKAYKLKRIREEYKVASVNRELEFQRAVFRWAELRDWIKKTPFKQGAPLINSSFRHTELKNH